MTKFSGKDMTLTIGGNAITCLQSVETDEAVDVFEISCAAATYKEKVVGLASARMTVTFALDQNDTTELGYVDPGDTGAVLFKPAGATTGYIQIDATAATVGNRRMSYPVEGFAVCTVDVELDDLAITAHI